MAFVDNVQSVTGTDNFRHLGGNNNNRFPRLCQIINHTVNLVFCAYVDTAGRLIQNQHVRLGQHPLGKNNLLLITS